MNKRIIYNAIRTPDGTVLESRHVYDYKTHTLMKMVKCIWLMVD